MILDRYSLLEGELRRFCYFLSLYIKQKIQQVLPLNRFVPNAPYLYPMKTSENPTVFWCFQRIEKMCIGNEWVKWAGTSLFKLSLRSDFKTIWKSTSEWPTHISQNQMWKSYNQNYYLPIAIWKSLKYIGENLY